MVNTPIPHSLKSEAKKAAKILREFTMPSARAGPDKLIPASILAKAKGLAIITVFKAGFLVTARGGSGVVIAKLEEEDDHYEKGWSAPSAIGLAGLGGGFEIGAEVTDFVIILNSQTAVDAFSKGGNLTLGGNFTIAAGPLGRNLEGDVSVRSPSAIYTYSKTKGIFAGISIEGSCLIERKDANRKFYGEDIRAYQILSGEVEPPEECIALYEVLSNHRNEAIRAGLAMVKDEVYKHRHTIKDRVSEGLSSRFQSFRSGGEKGSQKEVVRSSSTVSSVKMGRNFKGTQQKEVVTRTTRTTVRTATKSGHNLSPEKLSIAAGGGLGSVEVIAEHEFKGQLSSDLSFKPGDKITVLTRTQSHFDWWEGALHGKIGIFPANFVRVI
ncbi:SH3 domain-containing YSC84-like protein 1 [Gigantopelta aegis]|uniref:SH3 domain-containing YSC84-like protein 1 n=1 Tax=Gigantopelta aegis TaxID=1735272 RepID=UPI001B88B03F|nr:SH3 domain-containing YSC84-like protein 1 [Gigantopelta aegis]XP_041365918.1 SH3 domain-containing YSC84-like protein 1 [Gigantopelta aegis]XP_041365919.1 SH3 domain-containing YSC84-like protein 1 [Gigantopelta aegis]XP_041365920.1 SH3 domain-containing YSC84-like protein 1 [Gigantopelta aegis]